MIKSDNCNVIPKDREDFKPIETQVSRYCYLFFSAVSMFDKPKLKTASPPP